MAVVSYSLNGEKQDLGLRIDIDKRDFLDHFDNPDFEALASDAAPRIVHYLAGFGSSLWVEQPQVAGAFAD